MLALCAVNVGVCVLMCTVLTVDVDSSLGSQGGPTMDAARQLFLNRLVLL